jgi:N-acetylneuraminic acid mutarotase
VGLYTWLKELPCEIGMRKSVAVMLVVVFLMLSCLMVFGPVVVSAELAENSWMSKAPMEDARGVLGVAAVNGKIYAIGGSAQDARLETTNEFLNINEEYDPARGTWNLKEPMPTPRAAFAIAVYQNKIYCIGGYVSSGTVTGVNEVYDPATDTWETKTPMPTARGFLTANVVNGKIYLIGGSPPQVVNVNEEYDPATDTWTTNAQRLVAVEPASAAFNNKVYQFGSWLQIYNPETNEWSYGASKPLSLGGVYGTAVTTGVFAPKQIYVIGEKRVGIYNPENNTWTIAAQNAKHQKDFGVAVVNDLIYVVGGYYYDSDYAMTGLGVFEALALNEQYTPFGYGTIPPQVTVVSPENMKYNSSSVPLTFTVNKPAAWIGYSLDGQDNVTATGNPTLSGLPNGSHTIIVYTRDEFGNTATSETINFTTEETFPTTTLIIAATAMAVATSITIIYFKKRKQ